MPAPLREVATLFLRLGLTAFGGPAAHVALMHDQVVRQRRWLTDAQFMDLVGLANLVPGPNSTELAIHIGRERAGWRGFAAAGVAFIAPAMLIVLALAWVYAQYGALPQVAGVLAGVKGVMIAIIAQALWALGPKAVKSALTAVLGVVAIVLGLAGVNEVLVLLGTGLAAVAIGVRRHPNGGDGILAAVPALTLPKVTDSAVAAAGAAAALAVPFSQATLFLTCLKIGAVMYGSGYVLLAFLQADFVTRLGWLTDRQLLDAIAVGQVTPGPLFTSATFIGYLVGGIPGGLLATLGIFLPSFVFVALTGPMLARRRHSRHLAAFLDGVNVAALALMAVVTWNLGRTVAADAMLIPVALLAFALLLRTRVGALRLIAGGAVFGLVRVVLTHATLR